MAGRSRNYGDRFTSEIQLFAAAVYVVLYLNPRGSTSYGEEFGNLIHHNYRDKIMMTDVRRRCRDQTGLRRS